jgi:hypothetical protein
MLRERALPHPAAVIEPCLPRPGKQPPAGRGWIHEIKHDGFRIMARRADGRVRLLTRKGNDFSRRFPQIVAALTVLPVRSCLLDGEAVVCNENGLAVFDLIRGYRHDSAPVLCAFDLLELDGEDLRRTPIRGASTRYRRSPARRLGDRRSRRRPRSREIIFDAREIYLKAPLSFTSASITLLADRVVFGPNAAINRAYRNSEYPL